MIQMLIAGREHKAKNPRFTQYQMIRKEFEFHKQTRKNLNLQNYDKCLNVYMYGFKAEVYIVYTT